MNALELADELEKVVDVRHYASEVLRKEVITMLRTLHAENEALKTSLQEAVDGMGGSYHIWSKKAKELLK